MTTLPSLLVRTSFCISLGLASLALAACGEVKSVAPDAMSVPVDAAQPGTDSALPLPIDAAAPDASPGPLVTLSQSNSQSIRLGLSVYCRKSGTTPPIQANNSYFRVFRLADFDIGGEFQVADVQIGVEIADGGDGLQPAQVFLYTLAEGLELQRDNLEMVAERSYEIPDQQASIHTMPISATIPAGATLVAEFFVPDGSAFNDRFLVGCNDDGDLEPSYIETPSCSEVPQGIVALPQAGPGFETRAVVLNVRGYDLSRAP